MHEIPHEVGDFAILLKSGFSRWDAARAQLLTASAGLLGALVAIGGTNVTNAMEARTSWIMPFTAGGFLHISLVTVLPDLLKEDDSKESIKQLMALVAGIAVMAVMTILFESWIKSKIQKQTNPAFNSLGMIVTTEHPIVDNTQLEVPKKIQQKQHEHEQQNTHIHKWGFMSF